MTVRLSCPPVRPALPSIALAAVLACGLGGAAHASQNANIILGKDSLACSDHFSDNVVRQPFKVRTDGNGWQHCISLAPPKPATGGTAGVSETAAVSAETAATSSSAETGRSAGSDRTSALSSPRP